MNPIRHTYNWVVYMIGRIKRSAKARYMDKVLRNAIGGGGTSKVRRIALSDLIDLQCRHNRFEHLGVAVRVLAIENEYGKNDYGWDLYRKLQLIRGNGTINADDAVKSFKALIHSVEENSYDLNSNIIVDKELTLCDGAHRVACAYYFGCQEVSVAIMNISYPIEYIDYGMEWFLTNGFSFEEVNGILKKTNEIIGKFQKKLSFIVWPPVVKYLDEIKECLGYYGQIDEIRSYTIPKGLLPYVVALIYGADGVAQWQIQDKIDYFLKKDTTEIIRIILSVDNMEYRIKEVTNLPISVRGEHVKRVARNCVKKHLGDYFYDITIHSGDNALQNDYIDHVFNPQIPLVEILQSIEKYDYALVKIDTPYMPEDFPNSIALGKDLDIIVRHSDLEGLKNIILAKLEKLSWYEIAVVPRGENGYWLNVEKYGNLFYRFDISSDFEGLTQEFIEKALDNKIKKDDYYVFRIEDECKVREAVLKKSPDKTWHKEWLEKYYS